MSEGEAWGEVWRDLQNRYFAEQGLDIRVDVRSAVAQAHIGPIRMRAGSDAHARRCCSTSRKFPGARIPPL